MLSDPDLRPPGDYRRVGSKCTFWRSVLSDAANAKVEGFEREAGLNAPFGARCFLTHDHDCSCKPEGRVLMHLLALGAF